MIEFAFSDHGIRPTTTLNAKGLYCPMPLLAAKKKLIQLNSGDILQVDSTDPDSRNDFAGWCTRSGNAYMGEKEGFGYISFFIRKK